MALIVVKTETQNFDVIIIGGGPAGMSAAIWCADLGLNAVLIEKESKLGGQLLWTFNRIENYLGAQAADGRELAERFIQHVGDAKANSTVRCEVVAADLANKKVTVAGGRVFSAKAIIVATGVRRRRLEIPGEDHFVDRGVLSSGVRSKRELTDRKVVVVGGGDAALENAVILSETASKVTLIHRRDVFSARNEFVEIARTKPNVEFLLSSEVVAVVGKERVERVTVQPKDAADSFEIETDAILVRIGVVPNTELFIGQLDLDQQGYIIVDSHGETSCGGVFAAGDVIDLGTPTIAAAAGMGSMAVKKILSLL